MPIKDFIHHYPRALFNDIPRVGAQFYDIPGSGRTFTTYPGRGALLRHTRVTQASGNKIANIMAVREFIIFCVIKVFLIGSKLRNACVVMTKVVQ